MGGHDYNRFGERNSAYVECKIDIRYPWRFGLYLKFGREVWTRDRNMRVVGIEMVFKAMTRTHRKDTRSSSYFGFYS